MATKSGVNAAPRLKLLFVLDSFPDPGAGTEGQFWLLFNRLDRRLVEPAVLLLRPSPFLQSRITDAKVLVLHVDRLRSPSSLHRIYGAARWARREKFQIAHIFFNDCALVFPVFFKLAGIKVVVSRRDLGFWYSRLNLPLLRFNQRFVDAVVANCHAVKNVVARKEHYPLNKIEVIYNGIRREDELSASKMALEGLFYGVPYIAIVANLRPLKRVGDAIRALSAVEVPEPKPHLVVIGADRPGHFLASHRVELERLAADLDVSSRVHFLGSINDPMPYISGATLCMLTSETEGLSNAVIEYMLASKPVVCTDAGGNRELVEDGVNGIVLKVGDVQGMTAALCRLLKSPELAAQMGARSRERARAMFSARRMTDAHIRLYMVLRQGQKAA